MEFGANALNPLPCHCDPDSEAYREWQSLFLILRLLRGFTLHPIGCLLSNRLCNNTLFGVFVLLFLNRFCLAVFNTLFVTHKIFSIRRILI